MKPIVCSETCHTACARPRACMPLLNSLDLLCLCICLVAAANPEEIDLDMELGDAAADEGGNGAGGTGEGDEEGGDVQQRAVPAAVFGSLAAVAQKEATTDKAVGALERLRRAKQ